jgi:hypothetical protein
MSFESQFRVSLKLKDGKSPHLYVSQIAAMMSEDKSLHPLMAKTLKMLKKTRTPFIMLPVLKEVVIDQLNFRHFDRSAEPRGNWVCTLWSDDEIKDHKKDPEGHVKAIFKFFEVLGYELFDFKECSLDYMKMLDDITKPQIEAQLEARQQDEY